MDKIKFYNNIEQQLANSIHIKIAVGSENGQIISSGNTHILNYNFLYICLNCEKYTINFCVTHTSEKVAISISESSVKGENQLMDYSLKDNETDVITSWNNIIKSLNNPYPLQVTSMIESTIQSTFAAYRQSI
jgi:hypothetical protein